jgi:hypothetical protein
MQSLFNCPWVSTFHDQILAVLLVEQIQEEAGNLPEVPLRSLVVGGIRLGIQEARL